MFKKVLFLNNNLGRVIKVDNKALFLNNCFPQSCQANSSQKQNLRYGAFSSINSNSNYLMTLAQCYFRQENYPKALEKLNQLKAENSNDIKQLKLLAKTHVAMSDFEEGLRIFQKIVELQPGDIEENISESPDLELDVINDRITEHHQEDEGQKVALALVSLLDEEFNIIPELLDNISSFKVEENRYLGYATLKESYLRQNKYELGIAVLEEASSNCPSYLEDIFFELAKLYHLNGETDKELDALEKTLSINENQFDVIVELGWIYYTQGMKEKAQQTLQKAQEIEINNSKVYFYQAKICQIQNQLDDAEKLLEKCVSIDGKYVSAQVYNQMGVLYLQRKNYKKAQQYFFNALEINNEEAQYYFNIALSYSQLGDLDQAINYYEKGLILKPNNIQGYISKGILLSKQKKYTDSIDTLLQALNIEPHNTEILIELAFVYNYSHNKQKVQELCNQIITLQPNHKTAVDLLNSLKN